MLCMKKKYVILQAKRGLYEKKNNRGIRKRMCLLFLHILLASFILPTFILHEVAVALHLYQRDGPCLMTGLVGALIHQVAEDVGGVFDR